MDISMTFEDQILKIREYEVPRMVKKRLKYMHPQLSTLDIETVINGLKDYFILVLAGHLGKINVTHHGIGVPSVVIDDAWHLFILNTKEYREFCKEVMETFVDHIPDDTTTDHIDKRNKLGSCTSFKQDVYNAYNGYVALNEHLTWVDGLPILFMADNLYDIKDGFIYTKEVLDLVASAK